MRLSAFIGLMVLFGLWELVHHRRALVLPKWRRWTTNLSMAVLNSLVLRFGLPILAVAAAEIAQLRGWGVLTLFDLSAGAHILVSLIVLDGLIYAQHMIFHKVPWLWRLHRVHHGDRDLDVTTAVRFHPIEIVLSMAIKIGAVIALGVSPVAVIFFEILLNGVAMFNHSNIVLWPWLDRGLRWVIVTPDMHQLHHSTKKTEHDSNYGFNLSCWDRLFGTYQEKTQADLLNVDIGLANYRGGEPARLGWSLWLPFAQNARQTAAAEERL